MAKKILVPIDGSENSFRAIDLAADVMNVDVDTITLLHVVRHVKVPEELDRFMQVEHVDGPPEWKYEELVAGEIIKAGRERAKERSVTVTETRVERGDAAKVIPRVAEEQGVDLILMGSRGLGAVQGLAFGSVSQKVAHLAKTTVVTIS